MNIDKNLLDKLAAMDDDSLAASIRAIAAASGVDLSGANFDKSRLDALRTAMRGASDEDIAYACRYLRCKPEELTDAMICACLASVSDMAVIPLADWLHLGSEARIILDAIPDNPIPCTVTYVSPRNQFTPKEVETRDEREKFMFRVKLQVNQDWLARNIDVAKSGMPGVGWVKTDPDAVWPANMQVK